MDTHDRNPRLYHITHVDNLASILGEGGLWCDNERNRRGINPVRIGYSHIKARRAARRVPCGPGGSVGDYVPFFFCPRPPMLYSIHQGLVNGYSGGQEPVLHVVTEVAEVIRRGLDFVFTDGHAEQRISAFHTDPRRLGEIDWPVVAARNWANTEDDNDRKRRKQAEFLVHRFCPWEVCVGIAVYSPRVRAQVTTLLGSHAHRPPVRVVPNWYY